MTTTVLAGALLGAATASAGIHLAQLAAHRRIEHPARLQAVLVMLGATFGGVTGARHGLPTAVAALPALVPAAAAATVDAHEQRLPDPLTAALCVVVAVRVAVLLGYGASGGARGVSVFLAGATVCFLAKVVLPNAVGWGDAKLAPSLASLLAIHGWPALYAGLLAWCGLVLATALLDLVRCNPAGIVAYGPALVAGTACGIAC